METPQQRHEQKLRAEIARLKRREKALLLRMERLHLMLADRLKKEAST